MTVGWYVHHHGAGHLHRFLAVREQLGDEGVVGLGSAPRPAAVGPEEWVALSPDVPADPDAPVDDPTAGGVLHWAPRRVPGLRRRTAAIAAWAARADPAALVVDVSAEVALLGRLLSVPTVLVAQRGVRTDAPHAAAYAGASAVLAPWSPATHAPGDGPPENRLVLCGAISRFDGLPAPAAAPGVGGDDVLLLVGAGGHAIDPGAVRAAAAATPGRTWHVAGALRVPGGAVVDHGPRADVPGLLRACGVVVGTAGGNVVAEVAAARRPLVLLPQARPFDEQARQAALLDAAGLATALGRWPAPSAWATILDEAVARPAERWAALHDGRGAERAAAAVRAVARGEDPIAAARAAAPAPAAWTGPAAGSRPAEALPCA